VRDSPERRMMRDRIYERWYLAFAVLAGCASFALAYSNRLVFPLPLVDDVLFSLPGLWWAEHFSLQPIVLHAPRGIFWLPEGFTLFIGLAASLFGQTIEVARAMCEASVAGGVMLFSLAFRKLAGSALMGAAATLWLLTPPVVYTANAVRMEAPIFLLLAAALFLYLNGYVLAAGSLLFAGLLFHPIVGLAAASFAVTAFIARRGAPLSRRPSLVEWVVLAVVAICLSAQAFRILTHLDLFHAGMALQFARKMGIPLSKKLAKPQGVILFAALGAVATLLWMRYTQPELGRVRDILPAAAIGLGILTSATVGAEPMYDVFALSVGPAIVFCLASRDLCPVRMTVSGLAGRKFWRRSASRSMPPTFS
jgi:hypothetical protein